ncbi:hypothetical protein ACLB2K_055569 [Fragaria x ananassa]
MIMGQTIRKRGQIILTKIIISLIEAADVVVHYGIGGSTNAIHVGVSHLTVAILWLLGVKSPIATLGAEIDNYSPPELVKKFEEIVNAKPQIFPKVARGWAVRYDVDDETAAKSAEEAHNDMLQWFAKHVKLLPPYRSVRF